MFIKTFELFEKGLHLNAKKTKVMIFERDEARTNARITVDDAVLEQVNEIVHLGCAFNRDGRYNADIERRKPEDISKKPIIWVLGGPGSGKGTQCEKIIAKYGFTHLSTGDLLRDEVKSGSERGKILTTIMEQGKLVPNEIVLDLLKEAMEARAPEANGFLIDGYPREKSQGVAFEKAIAPATMIAYFEASSDTLTKRLLGRALSSGRADDNEATIKLRLKTFLENNQKVLDQYPTKLRRINAERNVDAIFKDVEKILDPIMEDAESTVFKQKRYG